MFERERSEILRQIQHLPETTGFSDELALKIFLFQEKYNPVYRRFLHLLGKNSQTITQVTDIPCLPVSVFKHQDVKTGDWTPETHFRSSTTSGQTPSLHAVRNTGFYLAHTQSIFSAHYGDVSDWCVLALLPAYLEREGSSLVLMADAFIRRSKYPQSGFFLYDYERLAAVLAGNIARGIPTLLLGVSFALLDFAEKHPMPLPGAVIMETGGMKGRRKELTRKELHETLKQAFQVPSIHSEYGMTELFSQAYSHGDGLFTPAGSMLAFVRDAYDPLTTLAPGKTGALNVIDLANVDTCAFIATDDLGKVYADGRFEVLGRLDASDIRGCNLMAEM